MVKNTPVARASIFQVLSALLLLSVFPVSAATITRVVPIVLDVTSPNARYTTELVLTNDTSAPAVVAALYTPSIGPAVGGGTITVTLAPGEQRRVPDVLAWLRANGLPLPTHAAQASQGGTLKLDVTGDAMSDSRFGALARTGSDTAAPLPVGRAGTAYVAFAPSEAETTEWVYALSNDKDRTNLAVVNPSDVPVTFSIQVQDLSERGPLAWDVVKDAPLGPWGWTQISSADLLDAHGSHAARALVTSSAPVWAYAVVNDRVTNDGSFVVADSPTRRSEGATVAVETPGFVTEAALFSNGSPISIGGIGLKYVDSLAAPGTSAEGVIPPPFYGTQIVPDVVEKMRSFPNSTLPPALAGPYAGVFTVASLDGGGALVRTVAPVAGGGRFGVHVPALPPSQLATDRAGIYGLVADAANRANVAAGNAEQEGGPSVTLRFTVHDGDAGATARGSFDVALPGGAWVQINNVLRTAGVANGWVEVARVAGTGTWFAYGVVNDGANPGERTGDGAYVPMVR